MCSLHYFIITASFSPTDVKRLGRGQLTALVCRLCTTEYVRTTRTVSFKIRNSSIPRIAMLLDYNPILNKHIDTYISFFFNTVCFFYISVPSSNPKKTHSARQRSYDCLSALQYISVCHGVLLKCKQGFTVNSIRLRRTQRHVQLFNHSVGNTNMSAMMHRRHVSVRKTKLLTRCHILIPHENIFIPTSSVQDQRRPFLSKFCFTLTSSSYPFLRSPPADVHIKVCLQKREGEARWDRGRGERASF